MALRDTVVPLGQKPPSISAPSASWPYGAPSLVSAQSPWNVHPLFQWQIRMVQNDTSAAAATCFGDFGGLGILIADSCVALGARGRQEQNR